MWDFGRLLSIGKGVNQMVPIVNSSAVEPRLTATSVTQSPRYYGLFFFCHGKTAILFPKKKNR